MSVASFPFLSRRFAGAGALAFAALVLQGNVGRTTNLDARLLAAHNYERSGAGLKPLNWNSELAAGAAEWGEELAASNQFEHSPDAEEDEEPEGENLWMGTRAAFAPEEMVGMWIAEKKDFRPGIFPEVSRTGNLEDVGHYTQLMWRDTGQVGCAVTRNGRHEYLVCRYSTAGNVEGERVF